MTKDDSRSALAEALRRALAGEHDPNQLRKVVSTPQSLSALEKSAWLQLQNWSADEPLRIQYPRHAEFTRRRLTGLLKRLDA